MWTWLAKFIGGFRLYLLLPGLALVLISTVMLLAGIIWPWGWAVGLVLLAFSGKSSSEKKGYRF